MSNMQLLDTIEKQCDIKHSITEEKNLLKWHNMYKLNGYRQKTLYVCTSMYRLLLTITRSSVVCFLKAQGNRKEILFQ